MVKYVVRQEFSLWLTSMFNKLISKNMHYSATSAYSKLLSFADHWRHSLIVPYLCVLLMLKEGAEVLVSDAVMIALHCENIRIAQTEYMACLHHKQFRLIHCCDAYCCMDCRQSLLKLFFVVIIILFNSYAKVCHLLQDRACYETQCGVIYQICVHRTVLLCPCMSYVTMKNN